MKRIILAAFIAALITAAVIPPHSARAAGPARTPIPGGSITLYGVCSFPVTLTSTRMKLVYTRFTDNNGNLTMELFTGQFMSTFTNANTGYSQTYNISGPVKNTYNPDGSGESVAFGPQLALGPATALAGLPALTLFNGSLTYDFDSQNNPTSASFVGTYTDECAALDH